MQSEEPWIGEAAAAENQDSYIALILNVMRARNLGVRTLALRAGLTKSRAGVLLHRNPSKRSPMTLSEFRAILRAIDLNLLQAVVCAETLDNEERRNSPRYAALIPMLCNMFYLLPANLIAALEELEDMDGSEVRPEWAPVLQRALIKRVVHEVAAVANRRAALSDFNLFS